MLTAFRVVGKIADYNTRTANLYVALVVLKRAGNLFVTRSVLLYMGLYGDGIFFNNSVQRESYSKDYKYFFHIHTC